ncbi:MAG: type I polyketide synthase, partial [Myxococcota bacterium]|nr:type I polyketide synthase [Myxococcota bacterium]
YRDLHVLPTTPPEGVAYYSGHWGRSYPLQSDRSAAESILANATRGLDFQKTIEQAWEDGVRIFVEGGPQGSCTRMIDRILGERPHLAVSACRQGVDGGVAMLRALAKLISAGVAVDLEPLYGAASGVRLAELAEDSKASVRIPAGGDRPAPACLSDLPRPAALPPRTSVSSTIGSGSPPPPSPSPAPSVPRGQSDLVEQVGALVSGSLQQAARNAEAHGLFLKVDAGFRGLRAQLTQGLLEPSAQTALGRASIEWPPLSSPPPDLPETSEPIAFDRSMCLEFAVGSIGRVLGPMFAEVDEHPTRVRLPDEPLMLVDRIQRVEGTPGSLGPGRVVTEHDVLEDAWYLDGGRCPVCISVEAGQADLFLSGYLGIDLATRGLRVYRLLDAEVCFHRDLPRAGETIRYDIHIDRFIRQGSTWLFFFRFEGFIGDEHLISMREGCAGFFSSEQLESGRGLVEEAPTEIPPRRVGTSPWSPLVPMVRERYDDASVEALRRGDLEGCFGEVFAGRHLAPSLRLPGGRMKLVHRITDLDPAGGSYGLGRIEGETDVDPEAWYLTCHFVDDMVMPGTLMYEGCLHTLRVYLLRLGWVVESGGDEIHYAPIPDQASALRCRGQVLETTEKILYRIDIKELGYDPQPYVLADAVMFADGRKIVRFANVSYRLQGLDEARLREGWSATAPQVQSPSAAGPGGVLFDEKQILAYAVGKPSECFGDRYRVFDKERVLARLPGPPFLFLDRVTRVDEAPWVLARTDWVVGEWDVDPAAWFFAANQSRTLPFCILLEAALQPCGWLAAYLGSALRCDERLHFRNLEGTAVLHSEIPADVGTLRSRVRLTSFSEAGGMIIQAYEMELSAGDQVVYEGSTRFGFFPSASLAAQVGVRDAAERLYEPAGEPCPRELPHRAPSCPAEAAALGLPSAESLGLPAEALLMLDRIDDLRMDAGPAGLGFVQGSLDVNPEAWFFEAHFYQDPVIPGSLGLESFLQLVKVLAMERWPEKRSTHRFEAIALGREHSWVYRGQVIPDNERVEVRCWVDSIEDGEEPVITCSGFLLADGKPIYEVKGFPLRLVRT